jgi:hypothetical protein
MHLDGPVHAPVRRESVELAPPGRQVEKPHQGFAAIEFVHAASTDHNMAGLGPRLTSLMNADGEISIDTDQTSSGGVGMEADSTEMTDDQCSIGTEINARWLHLLIFAQMQRLWATDLAF